MQPRVVFEDEHLLVINKPAGVTVNRAETVETETLQDWVEKYLPEIKESEDSTFRSRSGMVHRLDKETSGIMIWAKTPESMNNLMREFKQRRVKKGYIALVHGLLATRSGHVTLPLARSKKNRMRFEVVLGGKISETMYEVENQWQEKKGLSLVKLSPKTGRTHQLRVVMKHLGHPIVADDIYLNERQYQEDVAWCKRLFLHAQTISFDHPVTLRRLTFAQELPSELIEALDRVAKDV